MPAVHRGQDGAMRPEEPETVSGRGGPGTDGDEVTRPSSDPPKAEMIDDDPGNRIESGPPPGHIPTPNPPEDHTGERSPRRLMIQDECPGPFQGQILERPESTTHPDIE